MKIGFDHDKYLEEQSKYILERVNNYDKLYLEFGKQFEEKFLSQGEYENRSIEETLSIGWQMLSILPKNELYRIKAEFIKKYMPGQKD